MSAVSKEILEFFRRAGKRTVKIGDTLHMHVGEETFPALERKIERALARGEAVTEDGVSRWLEFFPVRLPGKTGTDAYVWKDGNRVRVERYLVIKFPGGEVTKELVGLCWKDAIEVL